VEMPASGSAGVGGLCFMLGPHISSGSLFKIRGKLGVTTSPAANGYPLALILIWRAVSGCRSIFALNSDLQPRLILVIA
jgi:hypothetical protein